MTRERAELTALPDASTRELLAWLVRRRGRLAVTGPSMEPTLQPGDLVLTDRNAYRHDAPTPGHIVVLTHPTEAGLRIVKRVERIEPDGRCWVSSDNKRVSASDSRSFGPVDCAVLEGRVTARIKR